ncbi:hypothetical protein AGRA3207_004818 [Actinomadura graeca]|uniref:Integral membrane protein n=1 Tax=Actinomadura graeca TaxID=2750812 RepID=A0ABX8QZ74_9ACTN|nr:hypothetical protein [Actinomadura graeca]QXJ23636.1 hypothetical protein AGRA3207_004818 [Actinomadura graeca]
MLRVARVALFALLPGEAVLVVLVASGISLPRAVGVVGEAVVTAVLLLELVVLGRLYADRRRDGSRRWPAFRASVDELVPVRVRRVLGFDTKGLVSLVLFAARRRHGVPPGAIDAPYSGAQTSMHLAFLFVMALEAVVTEILLRGVGAPGTVRKIVLAVDVYSVLVVLAVIAACVTRPHVLSDKEMRIRYGAFFDLRVPRDRIASVRLVRNYSESGLVRVEDGRLSVAVSAQTNVVVELKEPITVVRPLGQRADARVIRFFADRPDELIAAHGRWS